MIDTISFIEEAFRNRKMPYVFLVPKQLAKHEVYDVLAFLGKHWSSITCKDIETHFEAIYWFTPEAFCFYLPGILSAGIKENKPDLIVNSSIISMLDRSPNPELWDDFFIERWPLLNHTELRAIEEWIFWLSSFENSSLDDISLSRSLDTITLLDNRAEK